MLKALNAFFTFWVRISCKYDRLRANDLTRDKSIALGVQSVLQSILCGGMSVLSLFGVYYCIYGFTHGTLPIFSLIGLFVCAVAAVAFFVQGVIGALIYMIYQFRLNRRGVRWAALVVWFLSIAAICVSAYLIFSRL